MNYPILCQKHGSSKFLIVGFLLFTWLSGFLMAQKAQITTDFEYGEKLFHEGLYDLAVIQFQKFLDNYETSPEAHDVQIKLAECLFSLERYEEALNSYLVFILKYPQSKETAKAHHAVGRCYEAIRKIDEAVHAYIRVSTLFPQSPWASDGLYHAGCLLSNNNDLIKSEAVFRLLLEFDIQGEMRSKTLFSLAEVYTKQKVYQKALNTLSRLITHPILAEDKAEATFMQGMIHELLVQFEKSESLYQRSLNLTQDVNLKQKIYYHLGNLSWNRGALLEAENQLIQAVELGENLSIRLNARMVLGKLQMDLDKFQDALKNISEVQKQVKDSQQRQAARFYKARCLQELAQFTESKKEFKSLIDEPSVTNSLVRKSLLHLGQISIQSGQNKEAIHYYNQFLDRFNEDALCDAVVYKKAEILFHRLEFWTEALETLHQLWNRYPHSFLIPRGRYLYGQILEASQRNREALQVYRLIREQYPGSYWDVAAMLRIEHLNHIVLPNMEDGWNQVINILERMIHNDQDSLVFFELGTLSLNMLKEPKRALVYFSQQLKEWPELNKDQVWFYIGKGYYQSFVREADPVFLDSAKTQYLQLIRSFPKSPFSDNAAYDLFEWNSALKSEDRIQKLKKLIQDFPHGDCTDRMLFRLANLANDSDSLDLAKKTYQKLLRVYPQSSYMNQSQLNLGKIFWKRGEWMKGDSLFTRYLDQNPNARSIPEIMLFRANRMSQDKKFDQAIDLLEQLRRKHLYSIQADSGFLMLADLYRRNHQISQAIEIYHQALEQDSIKTWAVEVGLIKDWSSKRGIIMKLLAVCYMESGELQKARAILTRYGRENRTDKDRLFLYQTMAEVTEREGDIDLAIDYLESLVKLMAVDTLYLKLGIIQYKSEAFENALSSFNSGLNLTKSPNTKMAIESRILMTLYRKNKISTANGKLNDFKKKYQKGEDFSNIFSSILLEQGSAYLNQKEFDFALETFTTIVEKYKNSQSSPNAEFEIGHTYLITNKIEKALKILTSMEEKYPGHPILAKVDLNLGDHYYRSQQFENSLRAFRRVIMNGYDPDIVPLAMRYLIKVYDSIRMWDAALGLTREYIDRFPEAEDILQKRIQIGIFYMNLKQYMDAVRHFQKIKSESDFESEAEIQYWIGKSYLNMGQFEQAIFEFLKVKYLSKPTKLPWASTALFEAGQAYMGLNKPENAIQLLKKVIRSEGATSDLGRIARKRIEEIEGETQ